jgi:hypothetical protein
VETAHENLRGSGKNWGAWEKMKGTGKYLKIVGKSGENMEGKNKSINGRGIFLPVCRRKIGSCCF